MTTNGPKNESECVWPPWIEKPFCVSVIVWTLFSLLASIPYSDKPVLFDIIRSGQYLKVYSGDLTYDQISLLILVSLPLTLLFGAVIHVCYVVLKFHNNTARVELAWKYNPLLVGTAMYIFVPTSALVIVTVIAFSPALLVAAILFPPFVLGGWQCNSQNPGALKLMCWLPCVPWSILWYYFLFVPLFTNAGFVAHAKSTFWILGSICKSAWLPWHLVFVLFKEVIRTVVT